ncbi:DUF3077 domain-containing protein [Polaromonas hydrogenivorans]|uniref:DUF3077 domain-containing protein n=1 Tax=Polaromonas hydrogenivorans TaxID=335476 RepID=A0AAU7LRG0_9BURK
MNANNKNHKAVRVTARHEVDFFAANGKALFSVNEGVPMSDAFNQLSILLGSAQVAVEALATSHEDATETRAHWAPAHLLTFAYALVQSMHNGYVQGEEMATPDTA